MPWISMRLKAVLGSAIIVAVISASGCGCLRCRTVRPGVGEWQEPRNSAGAMDAAAMTGEGLDQMPEPESPHPRFHPVPAWDVFHPPVDLSAMSTAVGPTESGSGCRPFFLPPKPTEPIRSGERPRELPLQ